MKNLDTLFQTTSRWLHDMCYIIIQGPLEPFTSQTPGNSYKEKEQILYLLLYLLNVQELESVYWLHFRKRRVVPILGWFPKSICCSSCRFSLMSSLYFVREWGRDSEDEHFWDSDLTTLLHSPVHLGQL